MDKLAGILKADAADALLELADNLLAQEKKASPTEIEQRRADQAIAFSDDSFGPGEFARNGHRH